ncbi:MAG: hypothetical protein JPMHGGIA_02355 [Saprospiraceae bacterium]|jgi:hypothetical protein|nr:hypothetical protein [Saprospiraceae bacterium]
MKYLLLIISLCPLLGSAQQYNDFETNWNLDIEIDTTLPNNIWQIGPPQKTLFKGAYSMPNALITDTISYYPNRNYSACQFRADMGTLWAFPYFVMTWRQKLDFDFKRDGGWIEASYDNGASWVNLFTDTTYQPLIIGGAPIDTLADGTVAFTGTDTTWRNMMICWSKGQGTPPFPLNNVMDIRLVFRSDTIASNHEGWLIDNLEVYPTVIDFIPDYPSGTKYNFALYPNPSDSYATIELELDKPCSVVIDILDAQGRLLKRVTDSQEPKGLRKYNTTLKGLGPAEGPLLVRCIVDKSHRTQKLIKGHY